MYSLNKMGVIYLPSSPSGNCLNYIFLVRVFCSCLFVYVYVFFGGFGFFLFSGEEGLTRKVSNYTQDI